MAYVREDLPTPSAPTAPLRPAAGEDRGGECTGPMELSPAPASTSAPSATPAPAVSEQEELQPQITFLYKLTPGPADESFGLNVAIVSGFSCSHSYHVTVWVACNCGGITLTPPLPTLPLLISLPCPSSRPLCPPHPCLCCPCCPCPCPRPPCLHPALPRPVPHPSPCPCPCFVLSRHVPATSFPYPVPQMAGLPASVVSRAASKARAMQAAAAEAKAMQTFCKAVSAVR